MLSPVQAAAPSALEALALLAPEALVAAAIPAVLLLDMAVPKRHAGLLRWCAALACVLAAAVAGQAPLGTVGDLVRVDATALLARVVVLCAGAAGLVCLPVQPQRSAAAVVAALGTVLGALMAAGAQHLLVLWLGLELIALAGYGLVALLGADRRGAEAGLKFALFGGFASALVLFGSSHLYGLSGAFDFTALGNTLARLPATGLAALVLVGCGLAYKLALVPLHLYAPDVYQGTKAAGLLVVGVVPKLSVLAALAHGLQWALPEAALAGAGQALAAAAALSLLVASLVVVGERDGKRILAFSGIGQAATAVLALACLPAAEGLRAALLQGVAYVVGGGGAFVCLARLEAVAGSGAAAAVAAAARRCPWTTAGLAVCLSSLVGLPPLVGFVAKWSVLAVALAAPWPSFALLAACVLVLSTVLFAFAYLQLLRDLVFAPPAGAEGAAAAGPASGAGHNTAVVVWLAVVLALGLGFGSGLVG
jgi:NADH-quinone oxidoreductase subunit N